MTKDAVGETLQKAQKRETSGHKKCQETDKKGWENLRLHRKNS